MRRPVLAIVAIFAMAGPVLAGPPQNFVLRDVPAPVPELRFTDGEGNPQTLADFRGKVVLLNLWATWCSPCRKEMPTLDRLQATLGGPDFEVLALSIDRGGIEVVKKFYADIGIQHLAIHIDPSSKAGFALATAGLPTTLLIDAQGQELGRLIGPAEWDAPDMAAFFKSIIDRQEKHPSAPQRSDQPL
ncbi:MULTISPECIES: TlpA family protein disulfide reductase [Xanthobacteraceae]|jgi:thiol-disulfide isomerase/thioredoxin|uniref:TlpA family protein disulfide reductase n=1 Tax=Xanthobacteraceae TaxID=335928 RepID=UPI000BD431FF|nr:MAG: redoxin [Rhizobiales bacterium 35-66-30]OYZ77436.1 MAG: redoxin [Rhizobiales bacterium 24-66-13]OZB12144.1 MAG: redoxin [Rhizobiales bacterium 39-66-18]